MTQDERLARFKPRQPEAPWVIRYGKWALYALALMGAVIAWRMM